jgi:hypothetical protein
MPGTAQEYPWSLCVGGALQNEAVAKNAPSKGEYLSGDSNDGQAQSTSVEDDGDESIPVRCAHGCGFVGAPGAHQPTALGAFDSAPDVLPDDTVAPAPIMKGQQTLSKAKLGDEDAPWCAPPPSILPLGTTHGVDEQVDQDVVQKLATSTASAARFLDQLMSWAQESNSNDSGDRTVVLVALDYGLVDCHAEVTLTTARHETAKSQTIRLLILAASPSPPQGNESSCNHGELPLLDTDLAAWQRAVAKLPVGSDGIQKHIDVQLRTFPAGANGRPLPPPWRLRTEPSLSPKDGDSNANTMLLPPPLPSPLELQARNEQNAMDISNDTSHFVASPDQPSGSNTTASPAKAVLSLGPIVGRTTESSAVLLLESALDGYAKLILRPCPEDMPKNFTVPFGAALNDEEEGKDADEEEESEEETEEEEEAVNILWEKAAKR